MVREMGHMIGHVNHTPKGSGTKNWWVPPCLWPRARLLHELVGRARIG